MGNQKRPDQQLLLRELKIVCVMYKTPNVVATLP